MYKILSYSEKRNENLEWLDIVDSNGITTGRCQRGEVHSKGLKHLTANVILLHKDTAIIQKRASSKALFPSKLTVSAGGHLGYVNKDEQTVTTLETAQRELREELGIDIKDLARFKTLGDPEKGISNWVKIWKYQKDNNSAIIYRFGKDELSSDVYVETKKGNISAELSQTIISAALSDTTLDGMTLSANNREACFFYVIEIDEIEAKSLLDNFGSTDGEAEGFQAVPLEEFINMGKNISTATDSLYCLFYGDNTYADQLRNTR
jgi:8-oxo-dGTP pyrophosphatase MutT (NUDIX family)